GGVLSPYVGTFGTPVAADRDLQRGGPPAQRLVGQPADHGAPRGAWGSAAMAPVIGFDHAAGKHHTPRFKALASGFEAELIKAGEARQVRGVEGSVRHVEVFQMGCVGTSIIGRPRP